MNFGERLQSLRKGRNLTQDELAEMINVTRPSLAKWERNMCEPSAETIVTLSKALGVSVEYLLTGKESGDGNGTVIVQKMPKHVSKPVVVAIAVFVIGLIMFAILMYAASIPDDFGRTLWLYGDAWLKNYKSLWLPCLKAAIIMMGVSLIVVLLYDFVVSLIGKLFFKIKEKKSNEKEK